MIFEIHEYGDASDPGYLLDAFTNNAVVVGEFSQDGSFGAFPIQVLGYADCFMVVAPEFEDSDLFGSVPEVLDFMSLQYPDASELSPIADGNHAAQSIANPVYDEIVERMNLRRDAEEQET